MKLSVNLNEYVEVRLTELGRKHLQDYFRKLYTDRGLSTPEYVVDKLRAPVYRTQLHDLMLLFGSQCYLGGANLFERNELLFDFGGE